MADGGDDRDEDVSSLSAPSESRSVRFDSGGSEESQASESSMVSSIAGTSIVSADVDELQTEVTALRERARRGSGLAFHVHVTDRMSPRKNNERRASF